MIEKGGQKWWQSTEALEISLWIFKMKTKTSTEAKLQIKPAERILCSFSCDRVQISTSEIVSALHMSDSSDKSFQTGGGRAWKQTRRETEDEEPITDLMSENEVSYTIEGTGFTLWCSPETDLRWLQRQKKTYVKTHDALPVRSWEKSELQSNFSIPINKTKTKRQWLTSSSIDHFKNRLLATRMWFVCVAAAALVTCTVLSQVCFNYSQSIALPRCR